MKPRQSSGEPLDYLPGKRREHQVEASSDRSFGLVFAAVFVAIGVWPLIHSEPLRLWALPIAGHFGGTEASNTSSSVAQVSSSPSLSLAPSRTNGVAPLAVFFDATGTADASTSRPFHELEYTWNFGDNDTIAWSTGANPGVSKKNRATGPVRNNIFDLTGAKDQRGVDVDRRGIEPTTVDVHVYNNTLYSGATGRFRPIVFRISSGHIAKNNLGYLRISGSVDPERFERAANLLVQELEL